MDMEQNAEKSFLDALYCDEEKWGELDSEEVEEESADLALFPILLLEQDLFWDDDELKSLFLREKETCSSEQRLSHFLGRKKSVEWILKINSHYGFSALTAILAVNYLDRFCSTLSFQRDKQQQPWMMQLAAVTCLSLASKVEETHIPLLLDLQVEGTECLFEAKTIQRMELLVLSSLKWRMNPVTPLSFLDHIIRRLGLKSYLHWEFLKSCENLLLSVVSDSRSTRYLPSVLATAAMLHAIHQFQPSNAIEYENQLLSVLIINKEEVDECYELFSGSGSNTWKRKFCETDPLLSCDSSNESWGVESCISSSSSSSPFYKKSRGEEQQMKLPSLSRVFVDAIKSPH